MEGGRGSSVVDEVSSAFVKAVDLVVPDEAGDLVVPDEPVSWTRSSLLELADVPGLVTVVGETGVGSGGGG